MDKNELKNRISMALKEPMLQQGFELICKENAELKEKYVKNICDCDICDIYCNSQLIKAKKLIEELSKSLFLAKGIIRDLIDETVDFKESKERATYCYEQAEFDAYKKAEQFINSEVEK